MTHIYFIRHGETDVNKALAQKESFSEASNGTDISLNETGKQQAQLLFLDISPDYIFSSPLLRVKETAEIFCVNNSIDATKIIYDDRLIEYSFGKFQGIEFLEISKEIGIDVKETCLSCTYDFSKYGGDSAESIKEHLTSFLDEVKTKYVGKTIVCFSSAGVTRMIYKILIDPISPGITRHIKIPNTSIHHFVL